MQALEAGKVRETKLERLSRDFILGYTKAITDITDIFGYVQVDLKHFHKKMTAKTAMELLEVILENREAIRERRDGFIRWNGKINRWEYFIREEKREYV